jgi:hypothetical protein
MYIYSDMRKLSSKVIHDWLEYGFECGVFNKKMTEEEANRMFKWIDFLEDEVVR